MGNVGAPSILFPRFSSYNFGKSPSSTMNRDCSVSTVTMLRGGRQEQIFLGSSPRPRRLWGPPNLSYLMGTRRSFPGIKRPGREADLHLLPRLGTHGVLPPHTSSLRHRDNLHLVHPQTGHALTC
jgi:hypothetical protein